MDIEKCNQDLVQLIKYRTELKSLSFSDDRYDEVEDALSDLEDDFNDDYGSELEVALDSIHEKYCPGVEVLVPTAYMAKQYFPDEENEGQYLVAADDGVKVELLEDDDNIRYGRIVLLPNPLSFRFARGNDIKIVWRAR